MRHRSRRFEPLTLAVSRPGLKVKCVLRDEDWFNQFWEAYTKKQSILMPEEFAVYIVRANANGNPGFPEPYRTGVTLSDGRGIRIANPQINFHNGYGGEIYFPFNWFSPA